MKLADYKEALLKRSYDLYRDNSLGIVLKTADDVGENRYGIYIPRLMMGIPIKDGVFEEEVKLDISKCLNKVNTKFGADKCSTSNFVKLTMSKVYGMSMPRLIEGEQVTIGVLDQDINSLYIKPFCRDQSKFKPSDIAHFAIPASGKYAGEDMSDDNTYYHRYDSVNQVIRIHMSKKNGEVSEYDIIIDGSTGQMSLTDGKRTISITTSTDEVSMINEAESTILLSGDAIHISAKKMYISADDNIEIESKKGVIKIDNVEWESKKFDGKITNLSLKGTKITEDYQKADITNKMRTVTSPTIIADAKVLTVTGMVVPGGMGFGAPSGKKPLPPKPQIDKNGTANFKGAGGKPLVKGPELIQLLTVMCAQLDAVAAVPILPVPPMATTTLSSMSSKLITTKVKG